MSDFPYGRNSAGKENVMYHISLQIHIFGDDRVPKMAEQLQKIVPPEHMTTTFRCFDTLTKEAAAEGDFLLLANGADKEALLALREWRKPRALVILCADEKRLSALSKEELTLVDDVWPLPLTPCLLAFRFTARLNMIQKDKEAWLQRTYLDSLINNIPPLIWFKDIHGSHIKVNESFCQAVGKTMEQVQNRGHYYIWDIPMEEYQKSEYICLESENETIEKGCTCLFNETVKTKYGMRKFKTWKTPIYDEDGSTILGTVGIASDITNYLNKENDLNTLLNNIPMGALICDTSWQITHVNNRIINFSSQLNLDNLPNYSDWKKNNLFNIRKNIQAHLIDASCYRSGKLIVLEIQETPLTDVFHNPIGYLCLFRDVTEIRNYEARLLYYANTDILTGLPNRHSFFNQLESHPCQPTALLFIDVDNFKVINDSYSHRIGDLALKTIADALQRTFPDALSARFGGDEFIVALHEEISKDELSKRVLSLQAVLASSHLDEIPFSLSVSVGITCPKDNTVSIDALIAQGDIAMYAVKQQGKGSFVFYDASLQAE